MNLIAILIIAIVIVFLAIIFYIFNYQIAAGQPIQFNGTKYMLEEASPEIRAAEQKLVNAIHEQLVFGFETGFSQENDTLTQKITNASTEFYGLVAEQDPEVFKLMQQQPIMELQ